MGNQLTSNYVPAAGFSFLTRFYDPLVRITCRETYFKQRMIELAHPAQGEKILDVGCGTGTLLLQMQAYQDNLELHGLDGDARVLKIAQQKAGRSSSEISFKQAYSTNIPYPDNHFDLITNSLMIHHLNPEDKIRTFREMHRVLKPDGRLILADWGEPQNDLMRLGSLGIRLIDGFDNLKAHIQGDIPEMVYEVGFLPVNVMEYVPTVFGTLSLIRANKAL
ncbi:class I SAM-dependent methyltransferase [Natronogracilivirga saccharolytica]|uniref:Class I SAM-dependent methyltransferase n=1 Tax=Natronogracilivirga saccharolytica TaxID=2812953 RepID=A0A8J7RHU4_9BACT|nr:class I SAM-dependent methyltransferase [Natronogracilivirga saccharolytica]MBP3192085.1 class I SAM-dependent methyltransferase [Natronogracilivirga saccharolytica]